MTSISNNSPLASYFSNTPKPSAASASSTGSADTAGTTTQDPLGEIRRFASAVVAHSRGGLLRALQSDGSGASSSIASDRYRPVAAQDSGSSKITLPDVATMDRDDAAKLMVQLDKLIDSGMDKTGTFVGYNGDQQTDSLVTYRDWLQARGGVSIYV